MENQESILDKVISKQNAQEAEQLNPAEIVLNLLKNLTTKEAEVLRRRFSLLGQKRETLEKIGQQHEVTRERVRQIERDSIRKLRNWLGENKNTELALLENLVRRTLTEYGGAMAENHLLNYLTKLLSDNELNHSALLFLISQLTSDELQPIKGNADLAEGWRLKNIDEIKFKELVNELVAVLEKTGQPITFEKLLAELKNNSLWQEKRKQLQLPLDYQILDGVQLDSDEQTLLSCLEISPQTAKNVFDEWGLVTWKTIIPRRVNDKIYLILQKIGKPLHFVEITKLINQTNFDQRQAHAATVHNELILDNKYILIGRGVYALKDWGFQKGTVVDIIKQALAQAGQPLTKEEIVSQVLKQRQVGKSTVSLALGNKECFAKTEDGKYRIV